MIECLGTLPDIFSQIGLWKEGLGMFVKHLKENLLDVIKDKSSSIYFYAEMIFLMNENK